MGVAAFFDQLNQHGAAFLPSKISGSLRFDLLGGERVDHWLVAVKKGNIFVSREEREADVVVTLRADLFTAIASGKANLVAAIIRNEVAIEGDLALLLAFRHVLPAIPGAHDPREFAAAGGGDR